MELNVTETTGEGAALREEDVTRRSKFLITISTNFRPRTTAQSKGMAQSLRAGIQQLLTREQLLNVLECIEGGHRDIDKIDAEFNVELGKDVRGSRIHSHIILDVHHHCKLRVNLPFVREWLPRNIDDHRINSVYVNVRMIATDKDAHNYVRKSGVSPDEFGKEEDLSSAMGGLKLG